MSDHSEYIIDQAVMRAYRRFKDWSKRGFNPDEVTWYEVRTDLVEIATGLAKEEIERQAAEIERLREALTCLMGNYQQAFDLVEDGRYGEADEYIGCAMAMARDALKSGEGE